MVLCGRSLVKARSDCGEVSLSGEQLQLLFFGELLLTLRADEVVESAELGVCFQEVVAGRVAFLTMLALEVVAAGRFTLGVEDAAFVDFLLIGTPERILAALVERTAATLALLIELAWSEVFTSLGIGALPDRGARSCVTA